MSIAEAPVIFSWTDDRENKTAYVVEPSDYALLYKRLADFRQAWRAEWATHPRDNIDPILMVDTHSLRSLRQQEHQR